MSRNIYEEIRLKQVKIETVEFKDGKFGVRRTTTIKFLFWNITKVDFLSVGGNFWSIKSYIFEDYCRFNTKAKMEYVQESYKDILYPKSKSKDLGEPIDIS